MTKTDIIDFSSETSVPHGDELVDFYSRASAKLIEQVLLGDEADARAAIPAAKQRRSRAIARAFGSCRHSSIGRESGVALPKRISQLAQRSTLIRTVIPLRRAVIGNDDVGAHIPSVRRKSK
ncbi:hypothetical protein [Sphingomonas sp. PAMC 26605]|uniref:hypothetical protein n=1 Tax=Sphingomonas sp. PAMC 26605 TaxID=1112214 RepID=UPI00030DA3C4|nr:hypothetical protein [Sphingomonas sp. PAMC 26605]